MSNMAQWGPKVFLLSPTKIIFMANFSTSVELKADSENDTSGTSPTNTRGLVARPVSFSVTYTRAAGVDPRAQLEDWESLVGKSNPLYIGGKRFGPKLLTLTKVNSSNFVFSPKGDFLSVTISLTFSENSGEKTSRAAKTSVTKTTTTGSVYANTVEKRKAMNTTASKEDKAVKKSRAVSREMNAVVKEY